MTKSTTRKQYTPEFKEEALRLANKVGVTAAARELGVYQPQCTQRQPDAFGLDASTAHIE